MILCVLLCVFCLLFFVLLLFVVSLFFWLSYALLVHSCFGQEAEKGPGSVIFMENRHKTTKIHKHHGGQ